MTAVSVGHALLGLLATGERHGYDLKRQYDLRFPAAKPLAAAQVYSTLERLRRDGLVRTTTTERVAGPDRTAFTLTEPGSAELHGWLREVVVPAEFVANPLAVKITLALLVCDERVAADFLRRQRAAHLARMRELTAVKTDHLTPLTGVLAADYAINHLDADLRWIDTALARVERLHKELGAS